MDAYISKPLQPQKLFAILEGLPAVPRRTSRDRDVSVGSFNLEAALERVEGDVDLIKELAGIFLDDCPQRMAEIRQAVTQRDATRLQLAAHTLKGSVSNFAAREAFEATKRLEVIGCTQDWDHVEEAGNALEGAIARLTSAFAALLHDGDS